MYSFARVRACSSRYFSTLPRKMYNPSPFKIHNPVLFEQIITSYPFATVVITQDNIPHISHVPLLFEKDSNKLKGHLARANSMATLDLSKPTNCVVIFQGPDGYISPSWYESKKTTGKAVPTWNYIALHIHGTVHFHNDRDWIYQNVSTLSDTHEQAHRSEWKITDAPKSYIDTLLRAVVGIEIDISSIEGKFKLSQNRSVEDIQGVIEGLQAVKNKTDLIEWTKRMNDSVLDKTE